MTTMTLDSASWISAEGLQREDTLINRDPFPFVVARDMLTKEIKQPLFSAFPPIRGAGYLPYEPEKCGETFNSLINRLTSPEFADPLGNALGIERLSQYPTYVSISAKLNKRHGTIHTDGVSKVATMLLYLNDDWASASQGCLRFLNRIDDIEDTVVPEIPPMYGTLVAFKRCDNSFHGHLPFEGERRVIQIAWLVSMDDKLRKSKRGKLSHGIKKLFGWFDKKLGRNRDDNAHNM